MILNAKTLEPLFIYHNVYKIDVDGKIYTSNELFNDGTDLYLKMMKGGTGVVINEMGAKLIINFSEYFIGNMQFENSPMSLEDEKKLWVKYPPISKVKKTIFRNE
ncbi:hypothetical protein [Companilactobacillus zhongbaensis]|uniref:hypothetical protein n=1 Tax=Companilactobacillus zhongbaensis TaxID=2486009 RepID=UPI000F777617|nr:hypothetical protein [Companilactobacillus zhongbaensis]